jgi:predicted dehydrogenase
MSLGVGIVGAGPVAQAIHLPTLATVEDRLHVAHVMDVDADVAAGVAARTGASWTTDVDELLADPQVGVVAICSPQQFHVEHVEAACAAGKRAILCEKPLAADDHGAARIVAASRRSGVPVIVGTMHDQLGRPRGHRPPRPVGHRAAAQRAVHRRRDPDAPAAGDGARRGRP